MVIARRTAGGAFVGIGGEMYEVDDVTLPVVDKVIAETPITSDDLHSTEQALVLLTDLYNHQVLEFRED